jgi:hypothetical protein
VLADFVDYVGDDDLGFDEIVVDTKGFGAFDIAV